MDRVLTWILLLYPRGMRRRYGREISELTQELIRRDGRSSFGLCISLIGQGLGCRVATFMTARVATAFAVATSVGCIAFANLSVANAKSRNSTHRAHPPTSMRERSSAVARGRVAVRIVEHRSSSRGTR
jgi:hypothetical protein